MPARTYVFEMESSTLIGYCVAAVFEIDPNIGDALLFGERCGSAFAFKDTTDERCRRSEQVLFQPDACYRLVGDQTRICKRSCTIDQFIVSLASNDFDNIGDHDALARSQCADVELQRHHCRVDDWISIACTVSRYRARHEMDAMRKLVDDADIDRVGHCRTVLDSQFIAHEITRCRDCSQRALLQEQR